MADLDQLPVWVQPLIWSAITLLVASLLGRCLTRAVVVRLRAWTAKTAWQWDDLLIEALQRSLPVWSVLVGLYVALGFWSPPCNLQTTLTRAIDVIIWLSVTLITAGPAGRLVPAPQGGPAS